MRRLISRNLIKICAALSIYVALYFAYRALYPAPYLSLHALKKEDHNTFARGQTREMGELTLDVEAFYHRARSGISATLRWSQEATEDKVIQLEVRIRQSLRPEFVVCPPPVTALKQNRQIEVDNILRGPEFIKFHDLYWQSEPYQLPLELHIIAKIKGASGEELEHFNKSCNRMI